MYNEEGVKKCITNIVGWRNHYDLNEIPALDANLNVTETGEYYQDSHPALRLDIIEACLPDNKDLNLYLTEVSNSSVVSIVNDIAEKKEITRVAKSVVAADVIYNSEGWINDLIVNESRFVGVLFRPKLEIGLRSVVKRLALQLTQAQTNLKLYLFHSHKAEVVATIDFVSQNGGGFTWIDADLELDAVGKELVGGTYYLGYYQDDLVGQAVEYKKLNWRTGYCGTCDNGIRQVRYKSISKYMEMRPFYVPNANLSNNRDFMFDPEAVIEVDSTNWGFNFSINVDCDLTQFFCENRRTLRNLLSLKVTIKVLEMIKYSQQINYVEEQIKTMIIRDLEGDVETKYVNLYSRYSRALKAVNFNFSSISKTCIPCDRNSGVTYGMM